MNTRCKPGDLAIILYDVPSCTANIGRVVKVHGPLAIDRAGHLTWLIMPVTDTPYLENDWDGNCIGAMRRGELYLEQPDAWMLPIRPDEADDDHEETQASLRELEVLPWQ